MGSYIFQPIAVILLMLKFSCLWLMEGSPFKWLLCLSDVTPVFFVIICFRLSLNFPCTSYSQEPSSSKKLGFLVSGNNWDHNVGSRALIIIGPTHFSQHVLVSSRFCLVYLMWTFQFVCIVSFTLKIHLCPLLNCKHFKGLGSYAF